jgi:RNase P subunit RPR2
MMRFVCHKCKRPLADLDIRDGQVVIKCRSCGTYNGFERRVESAPTGSEERPLQEISEAVA